MIGAKGWSCIAVQSAFLALLFIFWESTNLSVLAQSQDPAALLKLARELRDGATASSSLKEAAGFYFSALLISKDQFDAAPVITSLVDRQQDIFHSEGDSTPADSSLDSVKVYSSIAYELAELLEFSPALLQDFNVSSLELLLTAARLGNSAAQHKVSTIFGTGVSRDHLLPMDAGRSLVLEYMAALSGDVLANMGMGYRLMHGIGVVENCELALPFYEYAANIAADAIEKSAGYSAVPDRMKLSEATDPNARWLKAEATQELTDYYAHLAENGDSSAASTLGELYAVGTRLIDRDFNLAVYYLSLATSSSLSGEKRKDSSSLGNQVKSATASGQLGYLLAKNFHLRDTISKPPEYMSFLHSQFSRRFPDGKVGFARQSIQGSSSSPSVVASFSARAVSVVLGYMSNPQKIIDLLQFAAKRKDNNGRVGLGYAYYKGIGVQQNISLAIEHFQKLVAVHPDAGFYLGEILMQSVGATETAVSKVSSRRRNDLTTAVHAYSMSSQLGNVLAQHRLAHLTQRGMGVGRMCSAAVNAFKMVAERGPWSIGLSVAHRLYYSGDKRAALFEFSQLAAIGYESAQFNSAYILSKTRTSLELGSPRDLQQKLTQSVSPRELDNNKFKSIGMQSGSSISLVDWTSSHYPGYFASQSQPVVYAPARFEKKRDIKLFKEERALTLLGLSASQGNSESLLSLGDFYYYQLANLEENKVEASIFYQKAADLRHTHAIFNLGLMHEIGDGIAQDFHLAKRYYDQAADFDSKARIPRNIALRILEVHKAVQNFIRGAKFTSLLVNFGLSKTTMKDMAHFWRGFEFFIDTVVDDAIDSTFFDHFFLYFHRFMGDLTNFFYFPLTLVGDGRRHLVENFMETVLGKASDQKQPAKVNFLDNNSVYQKIKSFRKKMLLKAEATLNEYMGKYIYVNIWHDHDIDYRSKLTSAFPVKADDTRAASWMKKKLFEFFGQDISSESLLKDLGNLLILIEIFMTLFLLKILRCICLLRRNRIG